MVFQKVISNYIAVVYSIIIPVGYEYIVRFSMTVIYGNGISNLRPDIILFLLRHPRLFIKMSTSQYF